YGRTVKPFGHQLFSLCHDCRAALGADVAEQHQIKVGLIKAKLHMAIPEAADVLDWIGIQIDGSFAFQVLFETCGDYCIEQYYLVSEEVVKGWLGDTSEYRDLPSRHRLAACIRQQFGGC